MVGRLISSLLSHTQILQCSFILASCMQIHIPQLLRIIPAVLHIPLSIYCGHNPLQLPVRYCFFSLVCVLAYQTSLRVFVVVVCVADAESGANLFISFHFCHIVLNNTSISLALFGWMYSEIWWGVPLVSGRKECPKVERVGCEQDSAAVVLRGEGRKEVKKERR